MKREDLKNEVRVIGELLNKVVTRRNEGTANETISLELTVRTSEVEEHVVSFFAYKYTSKDEKGNRVKDESKISKLFTGYETVANEYKFIADENGDKTGELVDIKGSLSKNRYVDKSDKYKEFDKIKGTFCSRVTDVSKYKPCAVWNAHMYITKVDEEMSDKTGEYTKVMGMVLDYSEEEFEFRIYNEKTRRQFGKKFDAKDSTRFEGNIVNRPDEAVEVEEEDDDDVFGEKMEVSASGSGTIRRRYLEIITGDGRIMDTDDEEHPLNEDKIKDYKQNIAKKKADTIAKHEEKQKQSNKTANNIDPNVGVEDDMDDIPF